MLEHFPKLDVTAPPRGNFDLDVGTAGLAAEQGITRIKMHTSHTQVLV
jgi:hypothetical protein